MPLDESELMYELSAEFRAPGAWETHVPEKFEKLDNPLLEFLVEKEIVLSGAESLETLLKDYIPEEALKSTSILGKYISDIEYVALSREPDLVFTKEEFEQLKKLVEIAKYLNSRFNSYSSFVSLDLLNSFSRIAIATGYAMMRTGVYKKADFLPDALRLGIDLRRKIIARFSESLIHDKVFLQEDRLNLERTLDMTEQIKVYSLANLYNQLAEDYRRLGMYWLDQKRTPDNLELSRAYFEEARKLKRIANNGYSEIRRSVRQNPPESVLPVLSAENDNTLKLDIRVTQLKSIEYAILALNLTKTRKYLKSKTSSDNHTPPQIVARYNGRLARFVLFVNSNYVDKGREDRDIGFDPKLYEVGYHMALSAAKIYNSERMLSNPMFEAENRMEAFFNYRLAGMFARNLIGHSENVIPDTFRTHYRSAHKQLLALEKLGVSQVYECYPENNGVSVELKSRRIDHKLSDLKESIMPFV